jgi:hypothetical protein
VETITVQIRVRWWFPLYVSGLRLMVHLTEMEPDEEKLQAVCRKAVYTKVV